MWPLAVGGLVLGALNYMDQKDKADNQKKYESTKERWSPWTHQHGQFVQDPSLLNNLLQGGVTGASMGSMLMGGADSGASGVGDSTDPKNVNPNFMGPPSAYKMPEDEGLKSAAEAAATADATPPAEKQDPGHVGGMSQAPAPKVASPTDVAPAAPGHAAQVAPPPPPPPGGPSYQYSGGAVGGGQVPQNPGYQSMPPMQAAMNPYAPPGPPVPVDQLGNPYQYSQDAAGGGQVPYNPDYYARHPEIRRNPYSRMAE